VWVTRRLVLATWRRADRACRTERGALVAKGVLAVLGAALGVIGVIAGYWVTERLEVVGVPVPLAVYEYSKEHRDVYELQPIVVPIVMDVAIGVALVHGVGWLVLRRRESKPRVSPS
jgi:hypothetical protein